jgi:hypothetical protein
MFTLNYSTIRSLPKNIYVRKISKSKALSQVAIHGGWARPSDSAAALTEGGMFPFGFIADFEGGELHGPEFPSGTPKRQGRLHPTLRFNAGTFYTEKPSTERITIKRKKGEETIDLGPLARVTGVKISLREEEHLVCEIDGHKFPLDDATVVNLKHTCPSCPDPPDPNDENDMQLYYDLLDIPQSMQFRFQKPIQVRPAICFGGGGSLTFDL